MSQQHTYAEIANNWNLWVEYADGDATMTREEFDALTTEQKIAYQVEAFGAETWVAWLDGREDEAVKFKVPVDGTFDVAEAGAAALGVEISDSVNVKRA